MSRASRSVFVSARLRSEATPPAFRMRHLRVRATLDELTGLDLDGILSSEANADADDVAERAERCTLSVRVESDAADVGSWALVASASVLTSGERGVERYLAIERWARGLGAKRAAAASVGSEAAAERTSYQQENDE